MSKHLAIDLGASSYRIVLSDGEELKEVYRNTDHVVLDNGLKRWDISAVYNAIIKSLYELKGKGEIVNTLAVNSWGCDFCFLNQAAEFDDDGYLTTKVYGNSYLNISENINESIISARELYELTAIQSNNFNTINRYEQINSPITFIASYINYLLTNHLEADYTIASTTQFFDKTNDEYNDDVLKKVGIKKAYLPPLCVAGKTIKPIIHNNLSDVNVIFGAGHDTAYALNHGDNNTLILNIGSWIILGTNLDSVDNFNPNYSYERGIKSKYKVVDTQVGMNIFNQILKFYSPLVNFEQMYEELKQVDKLFEVDIEVLKVNESVTTFCKSDDWKVNIASYLDSLAKYTCENMKVFIEDINPKISKLLIVGGGSQNKYFIERMKYYNCEDIKIEFGPKEATVVGNIKFQEEVSCGSLKK